MKLVIFLFTVIGLTIFASSISDADAAVDMFLKIPGIDGESMTKGHEKEIELLAWSWGATQTGAIGGGGAGAGKASFQDFHFTKFIDKSSPILLQKLAIGQHIPEATFVIERPTGEPTPFKFLEIKMTDLLVSSYQIGGSSGDDRPVESISLNFAKIEFKYTPQKADGTADAPVSMCYDLRTAMSC